MKTFYWHDYETWGATPSVDRPSQFAGVRTDENLNIISDPLVIYCQPPEDVWPQPEACLITGITPQQAHEKGLSEREFIARIHAELAQPNTCGVGYNTLRFDDEVTRYTLFRNLYDPYEREWKNGNSRWDIIDMVRLVYALRPEGIQWPMVDGKPSFKLENLTSANGIRHAAAHDAYSDVEATINLARLIKSKKPALYDYVVSNRSKQAVSAMLDLRQCKPLLHISSRFPAARGCAGLIAPLAMHPSNKNAVIAYDLSVDPAPMANMSAEQIRDRVFVSQDDLPEGEQRLPIKLVHINKCPILATTKLLDDAAAKRLGMDKAQCEAYWHTLRQLNSAGAPNLAEKLQAMYRLAEFPPSRDPEARLYEGFIADEDKRLMSQLRSLDGKALCSRTVLFNDERLNAFFFRYKARNFYASMSATEQGQWREFVRDRLLNGDEKMLSFKDLKQRLGELKSAGLDAQKTALLEAVEAYADRHINSYL